MGQSERLAFEQDVEFSIELANELVEYKNLGIIKDIESAELPGRATDKFNKMLDAEIDTIQSTRTKVVPMRPNYFKMIGIAVSFALLGLFIGYQLQIAQLLNQWQSSSPLTNKMNLFNWLDR